MSSGKLVLVSEMYWSRARISWGSVHKRASGPREETTFSRRSQTLQRAGQLRMACSNNSGLLPQQGQDGSGFLSKQEWWEASYPFASRLWCILPATKLPKPIK